MADVTFGADPVTGDTPHDGVDAGRPVKIGFRAVAHGATPTAVAAEDRVDSIANRHGIPFALGGHPNIVSREFRWTTAKTNADMLGAVSAGQKVVVTEIEVLLSSTASATAVRIGFGATSLPTTPSDGSSVAGMVLVHPSIAPGSGVVRGNGGGILAVGGDGEELRITADEPTGGAGVALISYFMVES